ncbi:acyloxyacyl hydrolase [Aliikangiella sp. IMCC44359]|uniref:acyloxyacyl hydrolase n=1 Tax=Aliikangiella sp. IMCC44359 TaxID=3459125 RepID=UPI00403B2F1C
MTSLGWGISDGLIQSRSSVGTTQFSIGATWNTNQTFNHKLLGYGEFTVEAYASHLTNGDTINLVAVRPVISFWESTSKKRVWFWQMGLGLAYLDNKNIGDIELSTRGQFATLFGLGMSLDKNKRHTLTLRYNHYSNAYIKKPNRGLDTLSLDWHYRL